MIEFEKQLNTTINAKVREFNATHFGSQIDFKAGANLLKPLLMKAIEQRDYHLNQNSDTAEQYNSLLNHENEELLKLIGDL